MDIERYTTLDLLKAFKPELVRVTQELIWESSIELSKRGVLSSGEMTEGYWRHEGDKKEWRQQFLYEDHPHESRIRYEFRFDWEHEYGKPMGHVVGEVLREKLMEIPEAAEVLTMFGHYGREESSIFVLVWIERKLTADTKLAVRYSKVCGDGPDVIVKEMTFGELWGFDPETGKPV